MITAAVTGTGLLFANREELLKSQDDLSIDKIIAKLRQLKEGAVHQSTGTWDVAKIFSHCAQSIEMSITGYPEHKSPVFKLTVGSLAFSAFNAKGQMTHSLDEPIPGAPMLPADVDLTESYNRLITALNNFQIYNGRLAEHFAYGLLTKDEYERAHVMHILNHLTEITS
ncbi:hypothetical protein theurythT_30620 [Thalassotalea eurytherma]|uniref:DUF1569 domain-containing protein n=1 Tax=Thalassotalea eurytherma TaxID=1144278 RepID=A0ABQ6H6M9_9GAMM|nr:hypothetical protein theurythT_30620 [Thalassotalea eurytherma]